MMSLRLELSRGAALQATTLKAFVRGPGVPVSQMEDPVNHPVRGQPYVKTKGLLAT